MLIRLPFSEGMRYRFHTNLREGCLMPSVASNRQITEGVIWKQILLFFFPILLGSFFQQLYNTVDTIIVGRALGTEALASVGASSPIINLVYGFCIGIASGATVILSQAYGAGDRDRVQKTLHTGLALALTLGVAIAVAGILFAPQVLSLIGTPENCMEDATIYCRIYFGGAIASMVYNMGAGILRAMGDSRRPMIFLMVCCFINILADLLFVYVFQMGIAGAALATIFAQSISAVLVLFVLMKLPGEGKLELKQIRFHKNLLLSMLRIGVPAGIQLMMFDFSNLIVQSSINSFGDATVAAWIAYGKTDAWTWQISGALGVSVTTFVGQNFGAQKYDRVRRSVWVCMGLGMAMLGALSVLEFTCREFLLGIFTTDPEVIRIGSEMMVCIVLWNAIFIPIEVFAGTMRGTGYALPPTLIMCVSVCLFRILWIWLAVERWHTVGVLCLAYPISWVLCVLTFFAFYLKGDWLQGRIKALGMTPEIR